MELIYNAESICVNILDEDIESPDDFIDDFILQYVTDPQEELEIRILYQNYE
jgi:hypothetical protein